MRKPYIAPRACLELFAPVESLTNSWSRNEKDVTSRWWTDSTLNFWGQKTVSNATTGEWYLGINKVEEFKK